MFATLILAAAVAGGGFSVTPVDGGRKIILSTDRPTNEMSEVRCRWTVYKDALPAASGTWPIWKLAAGSPITNAPPTALDRFREQGGDFALRIRFVTGKVEINKETLLSQHQIEYPRTSARELSPYVGAPAVLNESAATYEFKTPSQRIRFDRATGLLSGFATGWWSLTEWLARPMAFDFGESSPRIRLETFTKPAETNGVWTFRTVSWWGLDTAAKTNFEIRVATDWTVRGDGRVVSRSAIRPFGIRQVLPRVGWAFVLAPPELLVQYNGLGPAADSPDKSLAGYSGLYSTTVAGCGSHESTRAVAFDAGSDHFALSTLGDDFFLEVGPTASKKAFCGLVAERNAVSDHDWKVDILISPEKTLQALSLPDK